MRKGDPTRRGSTHSQLLGLGEVSLRGAKAAQTRGSGDEVPPQLIFLPATLPSFGGYIRDEERDVEIPEIRKVAVNKIPAMSAICVGAAFFPLSSFSFGALLPGPAVSLSHSLTHTLSLTPSLSPLSLPVEYGSEADRGGRETH